jgi:hypothetical protein
VVSGGAGPPGPPPEVPVASLVRVGREVARRAQILGAQALWAEIPGVFGRLRFSYAQGRVEISAHGWELVLSDQREWDE